MTDAHSALARQLQAQLAVVQAERDAAVAERTHLLDRIAALHEQLIAAGPPPPPARPAPRKKAR